MMIEEKNGENERERQRVTNDRRYDSESCC